jgi:hypothetical protein
MKRITVATYVKLRRIRGTWFVRIMDKKARKTIPEWDALYKAELRANAND